MRRGTSVDEGAAGRVRVACAPLVGRPLSRGGGRLLPSGPVVERRSVRRRFGPVVGGRSDVAFALRGSRAAAAGDADARVETVVPRLLRERVRRMRVARLGDDQRRRLGLCQRSLRALSRMREKLTILEGPAQTRDCRGPGQARSPPLSHRHDPEGAGVQAGGLAGEAEADWPPITWIMTRALSSVWQTGTRAVDAADVRQRT